MHHEIFQAYYYGDAAGVDKDLVSSSVEKSILLGEYFVNIGTRLLSTLTLNLALVFRTHGARGGKQDPLLGCEAHE